MGACQRFYLQKRQKLIETPLPVPSAMFFPHFFHSLSNGSREECVESSTERSSLSRVALPRAPRKSLRTPMSRNTRGVRDSAKLLRAAGSRLVVSTYALCVIAECRPGEHVRICPTKMFRNVLLRNSSRIIDWSGLPTPCNHLG